LLFARITSTKAPIVFDVGQLLLGQLDPEDVLELHRELHERERVDLQVVDERLVLLHLVGLDLEHLDGLVPQDLQHLSALHGAQPSRAAPGRPGLETDSACTPGSVRFTSPVSTPAGPELDDPVDAERRQRLEHLPPAHGRGQLLRRARPAGSWRTAGRSPRTAPARRGRRSAPRAARRPAAPARAP
jgi:hypothetical protein